MRDPHVERLHFEIGSEEGVSYENPAPLTFTNHLGQFVCRDGVLRVEPAAHFADESDARVVVEPFLRAWEIDADLNGNIGTIRFSFLGADVVDRNPPLLGTPQVISAGAAAAAFASVRAAAHITRRLYPTPPESFRATSDVTQAYSRWRGFRAGHEPLQSMAYFVLTLVEAVAGGRKVAARSLAIDLDVLGTIGRLSSTKGDADTARKVERGTAFQELSGSEEQWLEHAIRRVVKRLGEHAAGGALDPLRMADLPELK